MEDEPDISDVWLCLPAGVLEWATSRAERLGIPVSAVVVDALEVRAALEVAPQIRQLVPGGRREQHEYQEQG
ncbi:hypothetical protein [Frankia sp. QA3]|uniref:hypothetical protein n=1 Tax=Frankia sp. QA3 TaxID=710111 RepID=UPI000269BB30|nr:hypothetical protein [Frankia sp. QA3]EIV91210.1 hypothetical protein FraQA3DRAFT_0644 [Frankia sp. QA3]